MRVKFSDDVIPLTDPKVNPGRVVKDVADAHRPLLITSRGRGVAVVRSVSDYENAKRSAPSCARSPPAWPTWPTAAGREVSLAEAKTRLGLK